MSDTRDDSFDAPVIRDNVIEIDPIEEKEAIFSLKADVLSKKLVEASWVKNLEDLIFAWGQRAAGWQYLHGKTSGVWKKFGTQFTATIIALNTTAALINFIGVAMGGAVVGDDGICGDDGTKNAFMYIAGSLSIIAGGVASMQSYYSPGDRSSMHWMVSNMYGSLARKVEAIVQTPASERIDAIQQIEIVRGQYDDIMKDCPPVSESSIKQFRKNFPEYEHPPNVVSNTIGIELPENIPGKRIM